MSLTTDDQLRKEQQLKMQRQARVVEALDQLPQWTRTALLLKEWKGCSYAEISEMLGCPASEVRTGIHRARRELAKWLQTAESGDSEFPHPPESTIIELDRDDQLRNVSQ